MIIAAICIALFSCSNRPTYTYDRIRPQSIYHFKDVCGDPLLKDTVVTIHTHEPISATELKATIDIKHMGTVHTFPATISGKNFTLTNSEIQGNIAFWGSFIPPKNHPSLGEYHRDFSLANFDFMDPKHAIAN